VFCLLAVYTHITSLCLKILKQATFQEMNLSLHNNQVDNWSEKNKLAQPCTITWTQTSTDPDQPLNSVTTGTTNSSKAVESNAANLAKLNWESDWHHPDFIHNWRRLQPDLDVAYFVDQAVEREKEQELYRLKEQEKELYKTVESLAALQHRAQQLARNSSEN